VDKVKIDRKTLFTLASDTRLEILKKLDKRRRTLSELSKELGLSKTTVKEHLDKLLEVGLVKKVDENRKWIYYELTKKGKNILHPNEKTKFLFIISIIISVLTVIAILKLLITRKEVKPPEIVSPTPPPVATLPPPYPEYFNQFTITTTVVVIIVIGVILLILKWKT